MYKCFASGSEFKFVTFSIFTKVHFSSGSANQRQQQRPIVTSANDQENIMSLKKSAEIAALFSGAKINQTTDLVDPDSDFSDLTDKSQHHQTRNMSHKLGYFP